MRRINRQSVLGFFVGVVFTLGALITALLVFSYLVARQLTAHLPMPPVPSHTESLYDDPAAESKLAQLDGSHSTLRGLQGRPAFINFWATWCAPCVAELPSIQKLYDRTRDTDMEFVLITTESEDVVRRFLKSRPFTVPFYLAKGDLPRRVIADPIPRTLIVNRKGTVVFDHTGAANWDDPKAAEFIRRVSSSRGSDSCAEEK